MQTACENLDRCGYFQRFQNDSNACNKIWLTIFCESRAKARECARKQHMEATGQTAPDNLTPTGRFL